MGSEVDFRARLGSRLVIGATIALSILAAMVLIGAAIAEIYNKKEGAFLQTAQLLLSALLPLFGTWVGTVLAFYFSKENFQAASQGTLDLVRVVSQRLSATRVIDKMMPRSKIVTEVVPAGKDVGDVAIAAVEARFNTLGANGQRISRLLLLDSSNVCLAILHRSVYTEMLAAGLRDSTPIAPSTDPLAKLLGRTVPARSGLTYDDFVRRSIAFISQDKTVADAKTAMESVPDCQDVIVTQTGSPREPVVGWLSNVDISRLSQA
jgi:hypothetical protein